MKILGVITARGGSKGVPKKNLFPLNGKPLIEYTIDAALKCKSLDRIILSTDCLDIANFCREKMIEVPFLRPAELSDDTASSRDVIIHVLEELEKREGYIPEAVLILQPTSPLRTAEDLELAIQSFKENPQADSLVSVVEVPHNFSPNSVFLLDSQGMIVRRENQETYRRQDKETYFARNGAAIYLSRSYVFENCYPSKNVLGECVLAFQMNREKSIDIDSFEDLYLASLIMNGPSYEEWLNKKTNMKMVRND